MYRVMPRSVTYVVPTEVFSTRPTARATELVASIAARLTSKGFMGSSPHLWRHPPIEWLTLDRSPLFLRVPVNIELLGQCSTGEGIRPFRLACRQRPAR